MNMRVYFLLLLGVSSVSTPLVLAGVATAAPVGSQVVLTDSSHEVMKEVANMLGDKKVQEALQSQTFVRFQEDEADEYEDEYDGAVSKHGDFYKAYICKYYPKVFVIRSLFEFMRPENLEIALCDITMLLSQDPWFYFVNDKKKFKTPMYWEFIVDQCSFIDDFLRRAKVDLDNDLIIAPHQERDGYDMENNSRSTMRMMTGNPAHQNLLLYLKKTPQAYVFDFYALCFDYLIKLFNEGILIRNMTQAQRYLYELEYVLERLKGSRYEAIYQEALKTSKELMAKLKKILTAHQLEEDDAHYDEKTRKMMKEGKELGFYS